MINFHSSGFERINFKENRDENLDGDKKIATARKKAMSKTEAEAHFDTYHCQLDG